jgi:hypothetical protein
MRTLKESLLSDVDKTLSVDNAYTKIYPTPKVRDFVKHPWGGVQIDWICPNLIQEYIDILSSKVMSSSFSNKNDLIGFRIAIRDKHVLDAYLIDNTDSYSTAVDLTGIGSDGASIPTQKKEVIEFFNYIQKNPSALKQLFEYVNKRQAELDKNGMCDCLTFKQILKF